MGAASPGVYDCQRKNVKQLGFMLELREKSAKLGLRGGIPKGQVSFWMSLAQRLNVRNVIDNHYYLIG